MIWLLAAAFILLSAFRADKPVVTIFMIGDRRWQIKRWMGEIPKGDGEWCFPVSFPEDVRIDNQPSTGAVLKALFLKDVGKK